MALLDNLSKLTLGEIATIEELGKCSISDFSDDSKPKGRPMIAMAYVLKKREDPKFTINQAEALTMEDIASMTGAGEGSDPEA